MKAQNISFVVLALIFIATGCGAKTVAVSGTVSFDGEPGKNINVLFQGKEKDGIIPEAAYAETNAQGKYSLSLVRNDKSGAFPGEYVVYLNWNDPDAAPNPIEGITVPNPCPYNIPTRARSGQIPFTVPSEGTREADFHFKSAEESFEEPGV